MANKKAVLSRPLPDASVTRNAFDRESMRCYHYSLGQLLPVWFEPVIAGSHLKLNRKIFQRTAQLNTAAFPIIDTHLQYYFVPFRLMWSLWDDFKLGIQDVNSTALVNVLDENALGRLTMPNRVPYTTRADLGTALNYIVTNNQVDVFGITNEWHAKMLLQLLGYGQVTELTTDPSQVNLWPLLAYHKIYYDHFRKSSYENNYAKAYNMDYLWARNRDMKIPVADLYNNWQGLLNMHNVDYRNDYFNNLYPTLNYVQITPVTQSASPGTPGLTVGSAIGLPSNVSGLVSGANNTNFMGIVPYSEHTFMRETLGTNTSVSLTLPTLRAAFALDKLMRSSAYAPLHVKDQYEARFGIKFPYNASESVFIGAYKNDIQIGEVTSTADTGSAGAALGAIGGKGVGFGDWGKTLEFNAKEDGIVMAIQYSTVRSCYRALGVDSYLVKHLPEDYYQPEFQNLGLEPVYGQEFNASLGQSTVLGYRPRNQRYKLGVDKSYGLFADIGQDLSMFINHTDVGRLPAVGQSGVNYAWFKVNPSDLDGVMSVAYDGTWHTDQFFGQTIFGCTVIQNMSVHGQPSL